MRNRTRAAFTLLALCLPLTAAATAQPTPTLRTSVAGFTDVNGNGILDCGEPVHLIATFATNNSGTPALTGTLLVPAAGTAGLVYQPGSLHVEPDLTVGCQATIVSGNDPEDLSGQIDFSCPADPQDNNSWTVVASYSAVYANSAAPGFTAAAHASTSDGHTYDDAVSQATSAACGGAPAQIAFTKTSAGPGTPGSVLLYTLTATDESGLGAGGVQLVEAVPPNTSFDAAASSPGWICTPDGTAGSLCRNPVGNLSPSGTLSRFFALTIDDPLPAGVTAIANTACVRLGPDVVAGCASASTPTAGAGILHLAKALASGTGAPGATLGFALTAANTGNQGLLAVSLFETVPPNTAFDPAASSPGWVCSPGPAAGAGCNLALGDLAAGASATRTFALDVADPLPAGVTAIANTACVNAGGGGPPTLERAERATPGSTHLSGFRSAGGGPRQAGGGSGAGSAPAWSSSPSRSALASPGSSRSRVATAAKATVGLMRLLRRPMGAPRLAPKDAASSCATATVPTTGQPALAMHKTLSSGTAHPGSTLVYDLAVQNTGNQGATAVRLSETVPAATSFFAPASSPGWTCAPGPAAGASCILALGPLAAGQTAHAAFAVALVNPLPAGTTAVANTGCASLPAGPPSCDTVTTPTLGHPLLSLAKTYGGGPLHPGDTLVFQLAAANRGDQDAASAVLVETVPAHTTFAAAASSSGWSCLPDSHAGATCSLALGVLGAGATVTRNFALLVDTLLPAAVRQIDNAACLDDAGGDTACSEVATPAAVPLTASLQDTLPHDDGTGIAHPGDAIDYTLTVTNPAGATAVSAIDVDVPTTLDPHLTLVAGSTTTTAGAITLGNTPGDTYPAVHLAILAPGASVTITFRVTVAATLPASLQLVSSQAFAQGGNILPTASDDPDTPAPLDPTATPVGPGRAIAAIPTLSGLGLAAFLALLAAAALPLLRRRSHHAARRSSGDHHA